MAISEETFFLDAGFQGTLRAQIQQIVAAGILSGRLRPGEKMPSSRRLARHLGVSRITVTLAYNELLADDYLTSADRSGYFISHNAPPPPVTAEAPGEDKVDWSQAIANRFSGGRMVEKLPDWRRYAYPFTYGQADPTLFDRANWRLCALQALGQKDYDSLTADYADRDDPKLVEFIARHTLPRRGILARPEEILITVGAQNALWLAAQVLLGPGRLAAHENPCYPGLREVLRQRGCDLASIPVDHDGLPPDLLPRNVDVVFTTPSHQSPTTATMPMERRNALLARAARDEFLIVEDDYEFEMAFLKSPTPALKSLDRDGRVIYVGSFSKSLFPGLRLGYLVGSETFIREARALRSAVLRHVPGQLQRTAAYFLSLGHYDALIRRIGKAYHERRKVMSQAIAQNGLDVAGAGAFGGSSFWMHAPEGVDAEDLALRLRTRDVLIEPGRPFYGDAQNNHSFRLAYSSIPSERIPEGIARVAQAMAK